MATSVFITAAGTSRRFGTGFVKQLLPINHEPIIQRTIRQVMSMMPDAKVYVLTWHDALLTIKDVTVIDTKTRPKELADTILLSMPYWTERNIVLMGDTVFGDAALRTILFHPDDAVTIFARNSYLSGHKPGSERFALFFISKHADYVKAVLHRASSVLGSIGETGHSGMRKICYATRPGWQIQFITNTPINPVIRPARDFILYHIIKDRFWQPALPAKLEIINDMVTTDIDNWEEYFAYIRSGVQG